MYISAMKSNLTDKIVLVQNRVDENREDLSKDTTQDSLISNIFNVIPNMIGLSKNIKDASNDADPISLSDIIDSVIEQEQPTRIVIKLDIGGYECKALLGK